MEIFIEGVDFDIWDVVVNAPFIPTHLVNNVVVNKRRSLWTKDEKDQYNLKDKSIIITSLNIDEFYHVSNVQPPKKSRTPLNWPIRYNRGQKG